jgi:hypothetical protein
VAVPQFRYRFSADIPGATRSLPGSQLAALWPEGRTASGPDRVKTPPLPAEFWYQSMVFVMKRFMNGVDHSQGLLLPERLEDYVHEDIR